MWPEDFNIVRMTMKTEKAKPEEIDIRIKFISSAENMPDLLNVMDKKASMGRKISCEDKKTKLADTLLYLQRNLECYLGLITSSPDGDKSVPLNP
jgi:uncharacterized protein YpiB (UPF0302 family)